MAFSFCGWLNCTGSVEIWVCQVSVECPHLKQACKNAQKALQRAENGCNRLKMDAMGWKWMWRQPDQGCKQDLHMLLEPLDAPEGRQCQLYICFNFRSVKSESMYMATIPEYLMVHANLLPFFTLKNNQCKRAEGFLYYYVIFFLAYLIPNMLLACVNFSYWIYF